MANINPVDVEEFVACYIFSKKPNTNTVYTQYSGFELEKHNINVVAGPLSAELKAALLNIGTLNLNGETHPEYAEFCATEMDFSFVREEECNIWKK